MVFALNAQSTRWILKKLHLKTRVFGRHGKNGSVEPSFHVAPPGVCTRKPMCRTLSYPSPMRVLLKDMRTGKYFQQLGVWVQNAEEAYDFKSESQAIAAWLGVGHDLVQRDEHNLLEIVLHPVRLGFQRMPELRLPVSK